MRALRRALPNEDIVYLGDTARVPYGTKSPRTVERYSLGCLRFLLGHDVKLAMVACNTASANALPALEQASPVPVIGAVRPGARSAVVASTGRHIGVIGTLATVRSGAYESAIAAIAPDAQVSALACSLLVPLAEEGWTDGPVAEAVARRYLEELFAKDSAIDTLVLGCTHYPLLRDVLARIANTVAGRDIAVVDSATAMAATATEALTDRAEGAATLRCYVTDATRLDVLGPRFLGEDPGAPELVDL